MGLRKKKSGKLHQTGLDEVKREYIFLKAAPTITCCSGASVRSVWRDPAADGSLFEASSVAPSTGRRSSTFAGPGRATRAGCGRRRRTTAAQAPACWREKTTWAFLKKKKQPTESINRSFLLYHSILSTTRLLLAPCGCAWYVNPLTSHQIRDF